ncbi:MAG: alpha-E domain-containing protein [Verrucomicrobiota bacterium]
MLSRVADSLYWMNRYVERAESVARFVDVNLNLMLDSQSGEGQQWQPLVNTTGDHEEFAKRFGQPTEKTVTQFLTFDSENGNSIMSCISSARENARSIREIISSEMWEQLNTFYLMLRDAENYGKWRANPHDFFTAVKHQSHLFCGITDATMTHGEAWHFGRLGRKLERADKTSRMLDVKYFILLRSAADVGSPFDDVQWAAVLRSASAFEMYRKRHGRLSPRGIVEFLLLDHEFPRAIRFCMDTARNSLHAISGTPMGSFRTAPEKLLGQLTSDLAYAQVDDIINSGLHEYLDELQSKINRVDVGVFETFFARKMPATNRRSALEKK